MARRRLFGRQGLAARGHQTLDQAQGTLANANQGINEARQEIQETGDLLQEILGEVKDGIQMETHVDLNGEKLLDLITGKGDITKVRLITDIYILEPEDEEGP